MWGNSKFDGSNSCILNSNFDENVETSVGFKGIPDEQTVSGYFNQIIKLKNFFYLNY